jgi:xanthine dehydrogenase accessory factor
MVEVLARLKAQGALVHIVVAGTRGSTPREAGATMFVFPDGRFTGTIGGGTLEWIALAEAQKLFTANESDKTIDKALGPDLGQCCGGRVLLTLKRYGAHQQEAVAALLDAQSARPTPLYLFGAGHVGRALVLALAPLPFQTRWIDPRRDAFPAAMPGNTTPVQAADPTIELLSAPQGSLVAVMTHSHALDLAITSLALADGRFGYIGLIGSDTKRARFESQMRQASINQSAVDRLICPIGLKEVGGKEPAVIAAGIVAQLLTFRHKQMMEMTSVGVKTA